MEFHVVKLGIPADSNLMLGQSHFIKTVEDLYEILTASAPTITFGLAFCEASQERLVRTEGNDPELVSAATRSASAIAAGHTFVIFMRGAYPINVMGAIKACPEVCRILCATANPVEVLVVETEQGRGIVGVIDGLSPVGVEDDEQKAHRKDFLRQIGYKLG